MRKKIIALSLAVAMTLSLAACGEADDKNETTTVNENDALQEGKLGDKAEVRLGEYKGLTVYSDDIQVTDTALESYINQRLSLDAVTEYHTEGVVAENDKVKLSYKGTIDGEEFTGGSSAGAVVTMNSTGFSIEGFVDGIIGHSIGETVELDLNMPEDYSEEALKGKAVHFSVELDSLVVTITPELTDDWVKDEYSGLGMSTVGEFTQYLKNDLYINNIYSKIWADIIENSEVITYDKERFDDYFKIVSENNEYAIYQSYGVTLSEYLSAYGMTQEDWNQQVSSYVESTLKEEMVIQEIANVENIVVSDDEFNKKMLEYAKLYGYDSVEDFKADYPNISDEDFDFSVMAYYVQEYVAKQANVVQGSSSDSETTTAANAE